MPDHSRYNRPLTEQVFRTNLAAAMAKHAANRPAAKSRLELVGHAPGAPAPRVWHKGDPEPEDRPPVKDSTNDVWAFGADPRDPMLWFTLETRPMTWSPEADR